MAYLNEAGLQHLWVKIRDAFLTSSLESCCSVVPVVKGMQTAATSKWTGQLAVDSIEDGYTILYYLPYAGSSSAATLTLSINDNQTFAAPVYINDTACTTHMEVHSYSLMVYNASLNRWIIAGDRNTNTTYTTKSLGFGYGTCATPAETLVKVVTCASYALNTGGYVSVTFDENVPAGATMNINAKGVKPIYYRTGAIEDGIIAAGDTATFVYDGTYYRLLSVDTPPVTYTNGNEVSY